VPQQGRPDPLVREQAPETSDTKSVRS